MAGSPRRYLDQNAKPGCKDTLAPTAEATVSRCVTALNPMQEGACVDFIHFPSDLFSSSANSLTHFSYSFESRQGPNRSTRAPNQPTPSFDRSIEAPAILADASWLTSLSSTPTHYPHDLSPNRARVPPRSFARRLQAPPQQHHGARPDRDWLCRGVPRHPLLCHLHRYVQMGRATNPGRRPGVSKPLDPGIYPP